MNIKLAGLLALVLAACGGTPTGSTCPTVDPPTYANFGQAFMQNYCVRCHKNYATEAGIKADADEIDTESAKGPKATNTSMPEGNPKPTDEEREKLGQFIACQKQ